MERPFLIGRRIYLRPLGEGDVDRCLSWINDTEVARGVGRKGPISRTQEREWILGQYKSPSTFSLAIVLQAGDRHIGNCGLHEIEFSNGCAEFGILIGEKTQWGNGYAPEAAGLLLRYGFEEMGLHRIELEVYAQNERAQRAYEKAGFVPEGRRRESYFSQGAFHDTLIMGILKPEWEKHAGAVLE
jgi:RimJ/RimL family protein N-acetyltransferase